MDNTFDSLYYSDAERIAGLDESGVSDIAGPLVAACVILPKTFDDTKIFEVNDSKQIPERFRKRYTEVIWQTAIAIGIGVTQAPEVDYLGKRKAIILAMMRAIGACQTTNRKCMIPDRLLIDGELELPTTIDQVCIKDGDLKSLSIASASIIAKVYRDDIMHELHQRFPHYGWNKNKGAPCENQYRGLDHHGALVGIHRTRYYPFVPNKDKKTDERYWDWRRGLWRNKTCEELLSELGDEPWISKEHSSAPSTNSSRPRNPQETKSS